MRRTGRAYHAPRTVSDDERGTMNFYDVAVPTTLKDGQTAMASVPSKLFSERIIMLSGEVTDDSADSLAAALILLEKEDKDSPVTLIIDSPGGSVSAGLALVSVMRDVECPVHTVGMGLAASMASVILACGDRRAAYRETDILVHQLLGAHDGVQQQTDMAIAAEHAMRQRDKLDQLLADHCKLTKAQVHKLTERDRWLTPDEALAKGLIDEVL